MCSVPREKKINHVWIRLVGLPLQLWSHNVFKKVGDFCGGWIQTEEETELKNHLKWARIKVKGDGSSVPKAVKVEFEGLISEIQIWCEAPERTSIGEDGGGRQSDLRIKEATQSTKRGGQCISDMTGHVGCSKLSCNANLKSTRDSSREKGAQVLTPNLDREQQVIKRTLGQIFWPNMYRRISLLGSIILNPN